MPIVDAGPLYAAADRDDRNHVSAQRLLARSHQLIVPQLVVVEVAYLLAERLGAHAEIAFARSIAAGELQVEPVLDHEWERVAQVLEQYRELRLGTADASLVALAERLDQLTIATFDRRHFGVVRPRHGEAFTLVP